MDVYTDSFFGHRQIENPITIEAIYYHIIKTEYNTATTADIVGLNVKPSSNTAILK